MSEGVSSEVRKPEEGREVRFLHPGWSVSPSKEMSGIKDQKFGASKLQDSCNLRR